MTTHTRFFLFLSLVTAIGLGATMADAAEATKTCTVTERLVTNADGSQHIARKVVCVLSSGTGAR